MIAKQIIVHGDVQGVSYRYFAKTEAKKLGLSGWAKNEHDGTVTVFIQGESDKVSKFIKWSQEGSPMAEVSDMIASEVQPSEDLKGFEVK
jgi:acylphosphatase